MINAQRTSGITDLEKLTSLLDEWEVPYDKEEWDFQEEYFLAITVGGWGKSTVTETSKIDGYGGFSTTFKFTPEGVFVRMGAWE